MPPFQTRSRVLLYLLESQLNDPPRLGGFRSVPRIAAELGLTNEEVRRSIEGLEEENRRTCLYQVEWKREGWVHAVRFARMPDPPLERKLLGFPLREVKEIDDEASRLRSHFKPRDFFE